MTRLNRCKELIESSSEESGATNPISLQEAQQILKALKLQTCLQTRHKLEPRQSMKVYIYLT